MGCFGTREQGPTKESQKWDYITLSDFKASSTWSSLAYVWLWILFISTIAIYAVDTFTGVNLLIFNKWSSQVKPTIPFDVSKWIFAGCIIFSWVWWGFEWFRAIRVIKRGGVAESYMDPLAVSLQSMRSQGWRRFLVFAELTKSKKGMDLVAFFVYFAFKGAIRIAAAESPRQVINIITIIAVVKADFVTADPQKDSGIKLFWDNLQKMWNANHFQAIIIFSMLYSLLIWAISVICLAMAATAYIVFLWHYIPSQDKGLGGYCRRKVDKRLEKIVEAKVKAGIQEEENKRRKAEEKEWKKADKKGKAFDAVSIASRGEKPGFTRQPTLPQLGDYDVEKGEKDMYGSPLQRQDTANSTTTLPPYNSRPATRNGETPTLPNVGRPPPVRSATQGSGWTTTSYESDAPLLRNAGPAGDMSRPGTAFSRQDSNSAYGRPIRQDTNSPYGRPPMQDYNSPYGRPPMPRAPERSYSPAPSIPPSNIRGGTPDGERDFSPMNRLDFSQNVTTGPGSRSASPYRGQNGRSASPFNQRPGSRAESPYARSGSRAGMDRANAPTPLRQDTYTQDGRPVPTRQATLPQVASPSGSFSRPFSRPNAPSADGFSQSPSSYEMTSNPYSRNTNDNKPSGYTAFNANNASSPSSYGPPQRSMTATSDYFSARPKFTGPQRTFTAPPASDPRETIGYSDIVADYGAHTPGHQPENYGKSHFSGGY